LDQVVQDIQARDFVARDGHAVVVHTAQVDAGRGGAGDHRVCTPGNRDDDGVKEVLVHHGHSGGGERICQGHRSVVHLLGDSAQSVGPVVDGVERSDDREQCLRGANIGGGAVAANVL